MYIQITTRCNMKCAHCCNACTTKGQNMTLDIFKRAVDLDSESVAIGGGEPTIHPRFYEMLMYALGRVDYVWLATNGKEKEKALLLARLAKKNVLGCALSQDSYHEAIDPEVVAAFTKGKVKHDIYATEQDGREIRNVTGKEINAGRCDFGRDGCACEELFVDVKGFIHVCGCKGSPIIGNVWEGYSMEGWEYGECYKTQKEKAVQDEQSATG